MHIVVDGGKRFGQPWAQLEPIEKVSAYLSGLNLTESKSRLVNRLQKRFQSDWRHFQEVVAGRENGDYSEDVYSLKNTSLEFSLLAGACMRGEVQRCAMEALAASSLSPPSVLDIGCDNGLLTCFCALLWPSAEVVGVDPCKAAIDCAQELAGLLGLQNVKFVQGSAESAHEKTSKRWDLVLTVTVLNEAGYFANSSADLIPFAGTSRALGVSFDCFRKVTAHGGRWVAAELCVSADLFSGWCAALHEAGFQVDWNESGRRRAGEDLLTFVTAQSPGQSAHLDRDEMIGMWIQPAFESWPKDVPWVFGGSSAAALFAQLNPKSRLDHLSGWANERPVQLLEVWRFGCLCGLLIASRNEYKLQLRPLSDLAAVRNRWKVLLQNIKKAAPASISFKEESA